MLKEKMGSKARKELAQVKVPLKMQSSYIITVNGC
jgi:hypothetical protein